MNAVTHPQNKKSLLTRAAMIGAVPALMLGLTACSTAGEETGADVEDVNELAEEGEENLEEGLEEGDEEEAVDGPFDGPFDDDFYADIDDLYVGELVTVSALVNEVIAPEAFTIAGTDETTVEELLVLHDGTVEGLEPELDVTVTGTAQTVFVLTDVEAELGVDLDDGLYTDWEGLPYIDATNVDSTVNLEE